MMMIKECIGRNSLEFPSLSIIKFPTKKKHTLSTKMTTREHAPLTVLAVKRAVVDIMRRAPTGEQTCAYVFMYTCLSIDGPAVPNAHLRIIIYA